MRMPELLAPAGSMEALKAAIANGADAVYFGGKLFNARKNAVNFTVQEIADAVKLAHFHQVKTYITVNILLHNDEIEEAARYLKFLYNIGVDGIIVQDLGLIYLAQKIVPELKIHASTQMTIHNLAGVQFLAQKGFKRIVLARELSLSDIKTIKRATDIELEVFVHGALCVSYSGQCLMSSMMGGRSGNRGLCAQPCRLPYQLLKGEEHLNTPGNYLISPKDLSTIDILPDLLQAGVRSLKFEGRMKRPEYVATVIRIYRQALERCLKNPDSYRATGEEKRQLTQIFNRDFTQGYYKKGSKANLISFERPDNRGIYLGKVEAVNHKYGTIRIKLEQTLALGDGLEFVLLEGDRKGITVNEIKGKGRNLSIADIDEQVEIKAPAQVQVGNLVYKTRDLSLVELARSSFGESFPRFKIPVNMKLFGTIGEALKLIVQDEKGNTAIVKTNFLVEEARNRPLTKSIAETQLGRLGNTDFRLEKLEFDISENIMVPLGELNNLRRDGISQLEQLQNQKHFRTVDDFDFNEMLEGLIKKAKLQQNSKPKIPKLVVTVSEPNSLETAIESGADIVYINGEKFRSKRALLGDYLEVLKKKDYEKVDVYYRLPRLWLESDASKMEQLAKDLPQLPLKGFVVSNLGAITWVRNHFPGSLIRGDYHLNIFNDLGLKFLEKEGLNSLTLSPELTLKEIAKLNMPKGVEIEGLVHGNIPLMISQYCIVGGSGDYPDSKACLAHCKEGKYNLRDRKGFLLPVETDQFCRMQIFNPQDLCLIESLPKFIELGYHQLRIEAIKEGLEYVRIVTETYRKALDELKNGRNIQFEDLVEKLGKFSPQGLTKGHYYRGV